MEIFGKYTNYNFLLQRNFDYNPIGRNQSDLEAAQIYDQKVVQLLTDHKMTYEKILGGELAVDHILEKIGIKSKI